MIDEAIWKTPPTRWELSRSAVHVWIADVSESAASERWREILSAEEQERAGRFRFAKDRVQYSSCRGILRLILGGYLNIKPTEVRFGYNGHGKPGLVDEINPTKIRFNVAHSHGLALFAMTMDREIGIDVEQIRPEVATQEIAERFFAPEEVQRLFDLQPAERTAAFFDCWTRKEAFIKARGVGLWLPLNQFVVAFGPGATPALLSAKDDPHASARWTVIDLNPAKGYAGAVVVETGGTELRQWNAAALR